MGSDPNYAKQKTTRRWFFVRPVLQARLRVFFERLRSADLDCVETFRALSNFKRQFVTFAKFVERYADELVGVEKEILFLTIALDEPESLVSETGNGSFLPM